MLIMKINKSYYFAFLITIISFAKSYSQESADVSGGTATGTGGSSSYSVGQITYTSQTSSGGFITLGVQQPYEIVTLGKDDFTAINLVMSAYPNPTTDLLNLVINDSQWNNLSYRLVDVNGRIVSDLKKITTSETNLSMQELQKGIYFLSINSENKTIKTFKINKK